MRVRTQCVRGTHQLTVTGASSAPWTSFWSSAGAPRSRKRRHDPRMPFEFILQFNYSVTLNMSLDLSEPLPLPSPMQLPYLCPPMQLWPSRSGAGHSADHSSCPGLPSRVWAAAASHVCSFDERQTHRSSCGQKSPLMWQPPETSCAVRALSPDSLWGESDPGRSLRHLLWEFRVG